MGVAHQTYDMHFPFFPCVEVAPHGCHTLVVKS